MTDRDLQQKILALVGELVAAGRRPSAQELMQEAWSRWKADEFAVREALWHLISEDAIKLTPERTLQQSTVDRVVA